MATFELAKDGCFLRGTLVLDNLTENPCAADPAVHVEGTDKNGYPVSINGAMTLVKTSQGRGNTTKLTYVFDMRTARTEGLEGIFTISATACFDDPSRGPDPQEITFTLSNVNVNCPPI
jgi:hypothetical protein